MPGLRSPRILCHMALFAFVLAACGQGPASPAAAVGLPVDTPTRIVTPTPRPTLTRTATITPTFTPTIPPKPAVLSIASGDYNTCAVLSDGELRCWGNEGKLGVYFSGRMISDDSRPLKEKFTAVTVGKEHACGLTAGGGVKCWGSNSDGQAGVLEKIGVPAGTIAAPSDVFGLTGGVVSISAGSDHTCALMEGGGIKCWGSNWSGQLGDGSLAALRKGYSVKPILVGSLAGFDQQVYPTACPGSFIRRPTLVDGRSSMVDGP